MIHLKLSSPKGIISFTALVFFTLLLTGSLGYLEQPEIDLGIIMQEKPILNSYFLLFIAIGLILPLVFRIIAKSSSTDIKLMNSYLLLLLAQIISELSLILIYGKGLGVIVGFVFSSARLTQLSHIISVGFSNRITLTLFRLLFILWMINVIQIIFNRFIPLFWS